MGALEIRVSGRGNDHVVALAGELDIADATRLRDQLVSGAHSTVTVDLADLSFIDAAGLSALVSARRVLTDAGHTLRLRHPRPQVRRVFALVDLAHLLD